MLAGLSQRGLGDRISRPFTQIARWERNETEPGLSTLRRILQACGYDLNLDLVPFVADEVADQALRDNLEQPPSDRVQAIIRNDASAPFDPYGLIAALERRRVAYIVIGDLAAVIRGTTDVAHRLEIVPMLRQANLDKLAAALADLDVAAAAFDATRIAESTDAEISTPIGTLRVVVAPTGTRGYRDLRRGAVGEPLGKGLRPLVAPASDLIRMAQADPLRGERQLHQLRRLVELER